MIEREDPDPPPPVFYTPPRVRPQPVGEEAWPTPATVVALGVVSLAALVAAVAIACVDRFAGR